MNKIKEFFSKISQTRFVQRISQTKNLKPFFNRLKTIKIPQMIRRLKNVRFSADKLKQRFRRLKRVLKVKGYRLFNWFKQTKLIRRIRNTKPRKLFFNQYKLLKIPQPINFLKNVGTIMTILSIFYLGVFGYQLYSNDAAHRESLELAQKQVEMGRHEFKNDKSEKEVKTGDPTDYAAEYSEAFAILEIPKLNRKLPVREGTDDYVLSLGVGHISKTVFPGQGEQIIFSGHRETDFRNFDKLEIGDFIIVDMPYGTYKYEIREFDIVEADDATVIRKMGEEALLLTTCYPFNYVGSAPQRFVVYSYPVVEE